MVFLSIQPEPFARGRDDATVALPRARLMDLAAQAAAVRQAGMRLIVAAPLAESLASERARRLSAEITPDNEGFEYLPLPLGDAPGRIFGGRESRQILREAIAAASIVEIRGGGALSRLAWTLAGEAGRKRICTIEVATGEQIEPDRRRLVEADLGFVETADGSPAAGVGPHVHTFARPMIAENMLLAPATLARRLEMLQKPLPLRLATAGTQTVLAGTEQIINAIGRLARLSVKIHLDVIGDGKDLPLLREATRDAKLEQQVQFHGELSGGELADVWSRCHALVIAKLDAGPAAHFAAGLARGMPIIAYSGPAAYARAAEKGAATLVPKADIDHLADAMLKLHNDRARAAAMARAAVEHARELTLDAMHRRRAQLARNLLKPQLAGANR